MTRPLRDKVADALHLYGGCTCEEAQEVLDLLDKRSLFEEWRMVLYCEHSKDNSTRRVYPLEQEKAGLILDNERLKNALRRYRGVLRDLEDELGHD